MEAERIGVTIDHQKVQEILARFPLPAEFTRLDVSYGPDHDGDASVTLQFVLSDPATITDKDVPRLSHFMSSVVKALYSGHVGGFVSSRLLEAA